MGAHWCRKMSINKIFSEASKARVIALVYALDPEKEWTVEVKRKTRQRTADQNKWLWMCHSLFSDDTGIFKDDLHEIIKEKFLEPKVVVFNDVEYRTYSTKDLTTVEWGDFMEKYYALAASLGTMFPHPDDQGRA